MSKVTREKCTQIIQEFEPSLEARLLGHLGIDGKSTWRTNDTDINLPNRQVLQIIFYLRNVIYLTQVRDRLHMIWIIH